MALLDVIKAHGHTLKELRFRLPLKENGEPISQPALSQIVNGNPTYSKLQDIARAMGISTAQLIAESEHTQLPSSVLVCPHCGEMINIKYTIEQAGQKE